MKYLTRKEELVLLAICRLETDAYLVNIREHLNRCTEKRWSVGNVYVPLDRMTKLGLLDTHTGPSTTRRGGKAIRYYALSKAGRRALIEVKKVHDVMWDGFDQLALED